MAPKTPGTKLRKQSTIAFPAPGKHAEGTLEGLPLGDTQVASEPAGFDMEVESFPDRQPEDDSIPPTQEV